MARALITSIERDQNASPPLRAAAKWVRRFLCKPKDRQCVVGNRKLHGGGFVVQAHVDNDDRVAHVCPFVQTAIEQDAVWLEEHPDTIEADIEALIQKQLHEFKAATPSFDPAITMTPAGSPALNKTFINVFPYVRHASGAAACPEIQAVQRALKPRFVAQGMMLGEFFHGCPQEGLYNQLFRPLGSPYPMLAVRYLVEDDKLFNNSDQVVWAAHKQYFPAATWP